MNKEQFLNEAFNVNENEPELDEEQLSEAAPLIAAAPEILNTIGTAMTIADAMEEDVEKPETIYKKRYIIGYSNNPNSFEIDGDNNFTSESQAQNRAREVAKKSGYKYYEVIYADSEYEYSEYYGDWEETGDHKFIWVKVYETTTDKRIKIEDDFDESLTEGRADIYNELEDEYFGALRQSEENGTAIFIVKENEDDEDYEEFNTFEEAKKYAQEHNIDKIYVPEFIICYGSYCDGDYDEYDEQILDLDKNIITEGLKESAEGDQYMKDAFDDKNANFEKDKETTREVRKELAKQGIATDEEGKPINESVNWDYYDKFEDITAKYLPDHGEGENMAQQIVTAVNKIIYKWYNDGDVYDNTKYLDGWANDLSSYANWLYEYVPELKYNLKSIYLAEHEGEYEDVLKGIADKALNNDFLSNYETRSKIDSIYECDGPFKFIDKEYNEDDDYYESLKEGKYDHLINAYYVVDCDDEIKGQFLEKEEAKNLVKELKDTAKDYIYVTRNAEYEGTEGRVPDFEDIVNVEKQDNEWKVFLDKFNIFENNLTEKNWKKQLPNDIALKFRQAINSDDVKMKDAIEATNSVLDYILKEYPDYDYEVEGIKDNIQMINLDDYADADFAEYEDEEGYYQSNMDYFNEEVLNPLYDLCDSLDLWIPTEALIDESLNEQQIKNSEDYIIESLLKHEIKYNQDENKFYFTTNDDLIQAEEIICQIVGDKYTKNTKDLSIEVDFDNLEEAIDKSIYIVEVGEADNVGYETTRKGFKTLESAQKFFKDEYNRLIQEIVEDSAFEYKEALEYSDEVEETRGQCKDCYDYIADPDGEWYVRIDKVDNLEEDVNKDNTSTDNKEQIKKEIAELEKERAELEKEIDDNDNNPNYNLVETHKILKEIDEKIAKLKEEIGE